MAGLSDMVSNYITDASTNEDRTFYYNPQAHQISQESYDTNQSNYQDKEANRMMAEKRQEMFEDKGREKSPAQKAMEKFGQTLAAPTADPTHQFVNPIGQINTQHNQMLAQTPAVPQVGLPAQVGAVNMPQMAGAGFQPLPVPQVGMQNMAPPPMQLGQVSDYRAKTSIYAGNKQIEAFLQKVYNRISQGNK